MGIRKDILVYLEFRNGFKSGTENLSKITNLVLVLNPKRVYTDGLNIYPTLLSHDVHKVLKFCTNKIERNNLTIRTWLKRLNRKTIRYIKNIQMLNNSLKLLFWSMKLELI